MNERIKQLTIQALAECDATKMTPLSSSVDNGDGVDIPLEFSEKFAQLLVKECADIAKEYQNRGGNCYVDDKIKQHFGVEL